MRRYSFFLLAFLALISLTLVITPQVYSQPENIHVINYSWYYDNYGYFDVVGELQNVGPNTIESVILSGIVYTEDGNAQEYSYTTAFVKYLVPQQKAPFYMTFNVEDNSWLSLPIDRVDFTINMANSTSNYQYPDLKIISSSGGVDEEGVYWVNGEVQNSGGKTASRIRIIGTFFNSSGTVVAVGFTDPLTPISLASSDIASFKVGAFDLNQSEVSSIKKISSYSLLVQTEEPILSGTAPTPSPYASSSTTSPSDSPLSPTESPSSENSNSFPVELIYAIIIIVLILGLTETLLVLRKRKSSKISKKRKIK